MKSNNLVTIVKPPSYLGGLNIKNISRFSFQKIGSGYYKLLIYLRSSAKFAMQILA